jgi:hypothetical protein
MGEPIRIRDMAEQMIRFYGFEPEEDIKIEYVGLRPGERLGEKLWAEDENPVATAYSRILKVECTKTGRTLPEGNGPSTGIYDLIDKLRPICRLDPAHKDRYRNADLLKKLLLAAIPSLRGPEKSPGSGVCPIPAAGNRAPEEADSGGPDSPSEEPRPGHSINWSSAAAFRRQKIIDTREAGRRNSAAKLPHPK